MVGSLFWEYLQQATGDCLGKQFGGLFYVG